MGSACVSLPGLVQQNDSTTFADILKIFQHGLSCVPGSKEKRGWIGETCAMANRHWESTAKFGWADCAAMDQGATRRFERAQAPSSGLQLSLGATGLQVVVAPSAA